MYLHAYKVVLVNTLVVNILVNTAPVIEKSCDGILWLERKKKVACKYKKENEFKNQKLDFF